MSGRVEGMAREAVHLGGFLGKGLILSEGTNGHMRRSEATYFVS